MPEDVIEKEETEIRAEQAKKNIEEAEQLEKLGELQKASDEFSKKAQAFANGIVEVAVAPIELSKETEERIVTRLIKALTDVNNRVRGRKDSDETTGLKVVGNHFLVFYSNNFKDRDGEFFPECEIDNYIARVDMGIVPKPELQVWHAGKATAIGVADWVARHGHFTLAAGQFYGIDSAQTAKAYYAKNAAKTGISHGFTYPSKEFDGKSFRGFNTFEISLLPRGAEANWYTSLEGVKELQVDEKKVNYLKEVFGEEHAARILADWDKRGKALEELNVEFKDFVAADSGADTTATAHKEAVDTANKSLVELFPDLMEGSAEAVIAANEVVKRSKAQDARLTAQDGVIADLQKQLKDIRAELDLKPKSVTQGGGAALTGAAAEALIKSVQEQMVTVDPFTGLQVTKS